MAREFESGASRFTRTQGTSPRRWLLGTLGPLVLLALLALLCGVVIWRVLPATVVFMLTLGECAYLSEIWLRPWLFGIGRQFSRSAVSNASAWLAQHHYTYWVAYQPHNHLIWFELARNGVLVAAAALAVLASVWWLRIRPAD